MPKAILGFTVLLLFVMPLSYAQELDSPGFRQDLSIETDGRSFTVETVSNFDVTDFEFDKETKKLTIFANSGLQENLSEVQIPVNLINGNFTFFLNDEEIFPIVQTNEKISFITFEFQGAGKHKLEIIGTTYLPEFAAIAPLVLATSLFGIILLKKSKLFVK